MKITVQFIFQAGYLAELCGSEEASRLVHSTPYRVGGQGFLHAMISTGLMEHLTLPFNLPYWVIPVSELLGKV